MKNYILYITILTTAFNFCPAIQTEAAARIEISDIETATAIRIAQSGRALTVSGAQGEILYVYNLVGHCVMSVRIDQTEKRIDLSHLSRGIYPIKVGAVSKKICLQ